MLKSDTGRAKETSVLESLPKIEIQTKLTSAPIKANMLIPLKSPKKTEAINIAPEMVKMDDRSAISRKCDQPGVVGENDNCDES